VITEKRLARVAWRRSREYLRLATTFAPPDRQSTSRLSREYTRLFVAPRPLLYPYESMYRGPSPRVMGDSTLDVVRRYREAGFSIPPGWRDLPDHVALELSFMGALAENEVERWRGGSHKPARALAHLQRRFMEDHLLPWVPEFCDAVLRISRTTRFQSAADHLKHLIFRHHDWLLALTPEET
jgi:TorA maturation chaperone TorD